jgi:hypothetical protein
MWKDGAATIWAPAPVYCPNDTTEMTGQPQWQSSTRPYLSPDGVAEIDRIGTSVLRRNSAARSARTTTPLPHHDRHPLGPTPKHHDSAGGCRPAYAAMIRSQP